MATAYSTDFTDRTGSYQDRVYTAQALPNTTNASSSIFEFAEVQGRVELVITANTQITILDTKALTFELFYDVDDAGSFTDSKVLKAYAASGSNIVIAAGAEILRYTPSTDVEKYAKVKITATADQSAGKIDGQLYYTV